MPRRTPLFYTLSFLTLGSGALAQQSPDPAIEPKPIQQVEIKGPGMQELSRKDTAGRIVVVRDELARFGDTAVPTALRI